MSYDKLSDGSPRSAYEAQTNHTIELSRLLAQYAEVYDKWACLEHDSGRHRQESDTKARMAVELRPSVDKLRDEIKEMVK